jgi:putative acetyltransferase
MDALIPEDVSPTDPRVLPLIASHLELMRASSPACSVHAMEASDLDTAGVQFFAVFDAGEAVAIGALKPLRDGHGELKSMHVRRDRRGQGLADAILSRLIDEARAAGMERVSLETGSQEAFGAARAFYGRHGFSTCGPFEGYGPDPNSFFMTKRL